VEFKSRAKFLEDTMKKHIANKAISMANKKHELEIDFYKENQKYPFDIAKLETVEITSSEN